MLKLFFVSLLSAILIFNACDDDKSQDESSAGSEPDASLAGEEVAGEIPVQMMNFEDMEITAGQELPQAGTSDMD